MMGKRGPKVRPVVERFLEKVQIGEDDVCWLWQGTQDKRGYGIIQIKSGRQMFVHRVAYLLFVGPITKDKPCVCHTCDTPLCVNPNHLFVGTQADNIADMVAKNRQKTHRKLTVTDVVEIRTRYATGKHSQRALAQMFGVSEGAVEHVVYRDTWKHIA